MASFDTTTTIYLTSVFALAAIALVLSLALATTEVVRLRRLRPSPARFRSGYERAV